MEPAFAHPIWISTGIVLFVVGFLLVRWAARSRSSSHGAAVKQSAIRKLFGAPPRNREAARKMPGPSFRGSMAQFLGIVGFLLIIAGLLAALLGIFYVAP